MKAIQFAMLLSFACISLQASIDQAAYDGKEGVLTIQNLDGSIEKSYVNAKRYPDVLCSSVYNGYQKITFRDGKTAEGLCVRMNSDDILAINTVYRSIIKLYINAEKHPDIHSSETYANLMQTFISRDGTEKTRYNPQVALVAEYSARMRAVTAGKNCAQLKHKERDYDNG